MRQPTPEQAGRHREGATSGSSESGQPSLFPFDGAYLQRLEGGDVETVGHFLSYYGRLLRIKLKARRILPHVVEDIIQDTFLVTLQKLKAREIRDVRRLGAFISGVSTNVLLEYYRRWPPHEEVDLDSLYLPAPQNHGIETAAESSIKKALNALIERDRQLLLEYYSQDGKWALRHREQLAKKFGVSLPHLRVRIQRIRERVRKMILEEHEK